MKSSTPAKKTKEIKFFCKSIANTNPVQVPVRPHDTAIFGECFTNVITCVDRYGGSIEIGWTIWECPNVFLEAEFHACWRQPDNILVDVTPKPSGEKQIMFLPDPNVTKDFVNIEIQPNVRHPLNNDPDLKEFLRLADILDYYHIRNDTDHIPQQTIDEFARLQEVLFLKFK